MKIPPQSTLSGFFDKKIQEFDEWIVEVFEPFFEFWPTVRRPSVFQSHFRVSSYSEFQMPSQTAAERGEAELRILNFKTTWSEFQRPSQTAAERGKAELRILNFKTT